LDIAKKAIFVINATDFNGIKNSINIHSEHEQNPYKIRIKNARKMLEKSTSPKELTQNGTSHKGINIKIN